MMSRQKDKNTKRQKDKKTTRQKDKKIKRQKKSDVRAVSHSCDVLSLQIFTGSLLNSDGREKYEVNTETNMNFSLEEIRTFHWKKYELFTGRNMNFSTEEI